MKPRQHRRGFTLIEMLVVIAIIGILVAIAMPVLGNFRGDNLAAGVSQLLADVNRARQLAISQRTEVYMVFVPTNFWNDPAYPQLASQPAELGKCNRLLDKQWVGYNFVARRTVGDQPGRNTPRYLSSWKSLPEGVVIADFKFAPRNNSTPIYDPPSSTQIADLVTNVYGFETTALVPFPSEQATGNSYVRLPYIGFNHLGQLLSGADEFIPIGRGTVAHALSAGKSPLQQNPTYRENPAGNTINAYHLIHIDWLTGRATLKRQEAK